jgi:hypothetical protein
VQICCPTVIFSISFVLIVEFLELLHYICLKICFILFLNNRVVDGRCSSLSMFVNDFYDLRFCFLGCFEFIHSPLLIPSSIRHLQVSFSYVLVNTQFLLKVFLWFYCCSYLLFVSCKTQDL